MKLSQIRTLSWGTAAAISVGSTLGIWVAVDQARHAPVLATYPWAPKEPNIPDIGLRNLLDKQRIMSALSFITKIDQPQPILTQTTTVETVAAPVDNKSLNLGFGLVLISYDDDPKRRLVFLSKDQEEDPYAIGDSVGIFPKAKVNVIAHDYVEFLADDGRKQVLYLRSDDAPVAGAGVNGINRNIAPTEGEMAVAVASTPTIDTPPPADAHPAARRYVPTTRDVITDDEYGVGLVKYSNSPDGAERYAISEKDLASLQNQSLRLLSEVAPSTAYDENGKPNGIKIDFIGKASLFIKAGLQSGDVILEINGIPVKSIEEATAIYNGFGPNVRFVTVKILRKGAIFNVIFEMDDFPGIPSSK